MSKHQFRIAYETGSTLPWKVQWRERGLLGWRSWYSVPHPNNFDNEREAEERIRDLIDKPARIVPPFKHLTP